MAYISEKVKNNLYENLLMLVDMHKQRTIIGLDIAKKTAKAKLDIEIKKTEYAYNIASNVNIYNYQSGLDSKEDLFDINLGTKALREKSNYLKLLADDLNILDPEISKMQIVLNGLNSFIINKNQNFVPFSYLDTTETTLDRISPKRALIVILAILRAIIFSTIIALTHNYVKSRNKN